MLPHIKPHFIYLAWVLLLAINIVMVFRIMPDGEQRIMSVAKNPEKVELLDVQVFGFDEEQVHQIMTALGTEGRKQYIRFHRLEDFIFPFTYAFFLSITLFLLTRKRFRSAKPVVIASAIPLMAMVADFLENHHIALICKQFPDIEPGIIQTTSLANSAKTLFLVITFAAITLMLLRIVIQRLRRVFKP
jgi:hypothetical protein